MTLNMWIATLAWGLLVVGYYNRTRRQIHVPLMLSGIILDISLVLYLQLTRDAIQKALAFDLLILQQIHIGFSTVALVLYFPILYFGFRLLKDLSCQRTRQIHRTIGKLALTFRTLGFGFMFSMLQ